MATIKEFEVKANTAEAVDEVEKLRQELELTGGTVKNLEGALEEAGKKAVKGSKEAASEDREANRAKEEAIRIIDRATGGYVEMGTKAVKAYKVISSEVVKGIALGKQWIASFSFTNLIAKVKGFGVALKASFQAGTLGAKALRTALISTGIGALVVALGLIVAYWDDIVGAVSGVSSEQKKQLDLAEQNVAAQQEAAVALSLQENSLKLQGKSEKEIRDLKIQQTNETIAAVEAQLAAQESLRESQIAASKRNKAILKGVLEFITLPLALLLKTIDGVASLFGADWDLEEKLFGSIAEMVFDPEEVATEAEATIEETKSQLAELEKTRDGYLLDEKKEGAAAAKQRLEDAKKLAEQLQKIEEETAGIRASIWEKSAEDERLRENRRYLNETKNLGLRRKQDIAAAEGNEQLIKAIKEKYQALAEQTQANHNDALANIDEKAAEKALKQVQQIEDLKLGLMEDGKSKELEALEIKYARLYQAEMGNLEALQLLQDTHEKEKAATTKKYDDAAIKKRKDFQNQIKDVVLDAASATISNLMSLNEIYDKDDEAAAKRAFERNKSLQIVQAIINTAGGIIGQLNVPQDQLTGANWIKAAVIATTGKVQIATIRSQQFNGGKASAGGTSPKAPAAPQVSPSFNIVGQSGTNQLLQGISGQFGQPLRAYVVGSDVTSSQEMERKRIKTATFG